MTEQETEKEKETDRQREKDRQTDGRTCNLLVIIKKWRVTEKTKQ